MRPLPRWNAQGGSLYSKFRRLNFSRCTIFMSELAKLEEAAKAGRGLPPVHRWSPDFTGDLDMRIAADGSWHYQGSPIHRDRMVRMFSTILRKDADGRTYLVTPHEKYSITVEDAPFTIVEMDVEGAGQDQELLFRSNVGDVCRAGAEHPLRFEAVGDDGTLKPYVVIRDRLEALVSRSIFYDLVELGTIEPIDDVDWFGVWSGGQFWPMAPADEIEAED